MNNETLKNLEFIRTTGSLRGRAKRPRPRRQVKKARKRSSSYVENVFGRQRRHLALQPAAVELVVWIDSTYVENIRQINLFLQNKPNFPHFSPENEDCAKKQTQFKPNTKPIKANFGPISRVAKPNKPNSKPNKPNNQSSLIDNQLRGKPNSPIVQIHLTSFMAMNYAILTILTKVKFKPNLSQNKPNSNPIFYPRCELTSFGVYPRVCSPVVLPGVVGKANSNPIAKKLKMYTNQYETINYENFPPYWIAKTRPKQTQFNTGQRRYAQQENLPLLMVFIKYLGTLSASLGFCATKLMKKPEVTKEIVLD